MSLRTDSAMQIPPSHWRVYAHVLDDQASQVATMFQRLMSELDER